MECMNCNRQLAEVTEDGKTYRGCIHCLIKRREDLKADLATKQTTINLQGTRIEQLEARLEALASTACAAA